jgi:trimethylamine:corrinoid methyltransferase-like protein
MGAKNVVEVAREKVRKILAEHEPPSLDTDTRKSLNDILKVAAKALASF